MCQGGATPISAIWFKTSLNSEAPTAWRDPTASNLQKLVAKVGEFACLTEGSKIDFRTPVLSGHCRTQAEEGRSSAAADRLRTAEGQGAAISDCIYRAEVSPIGACGAQSTPALLKSPRRSLCAGIELQKFPRRPLAVENGPRKNPRRPLAARNRPRKNPRRPLAVRNRPRKNPRRPLAVRNGPRKNPRRPLAGGNGPRKNPRTWLAVENGPRKDPRRTLAAPTDHERILDGLWRPETDRERILDSFWRLETDRERIHDGHLRRETDRERILGDLWRSPTRSEDSFRRPSTGQNREAEIHNQPVAVHEWGRGSAR